jgi:hypothetical protein
VSIQGDGLNFLSLDKVKKYRGVGLTTPTVGALGEAVNPTYTTLDFP